MFQYICDSFSLEKIQPLLSYTIIWISLLINWSHLLFRTDFDTKFSKKKFITIFWEGHKILRNLHQLFVLFTGKSMLPSQNTWTSPYFLRLLGAVHKLRGPIFDLFWPPTYLSWTFVDIWCTTYHLSTWT